MRCCSWIVVILFVFIWTPAVFYGTGRHRFRYSLEPQCFVVLPSDLVKFGPPGYTLGHGVRDFSGVVAKYIPPLHRQACLVRSPHTPIKTATWLGNQTGQGCRLEFHKGASESQEVEPYVLPLEPEAGVADLDQHNCALFAHERAEVVWRNEDLCQTKAGMRGDVRIYHADMNASQCLAQGGVWLGGQEPVAPPALRASKAFTGSASAWAHVVLGCLYFILGLIQFENPGTRNRALHRWVGWLYVLVQLAVWVPTWGIILSASKVSVVRVCINAYGNLYWMYSLWRGIRHAQCKQFAAHRRWMMRNYSVALAIIFGRFVGTLLLFLTPFAWWRSADVFETLNILFGWLITFTMLEFYLQRFPDPPLLAPPPLANTVRPRDKHKNA